MFSIIISGAFRNLSETWPVNKKFFDELGEPYVVFVHTWRENYGTPRKVYKDHNWKGFTFDLNPKIYKHEPFQVTENLVRSVIPDAHIVIEDFHANSIIEEYRIPDERITSLHQNFLNSVAMYQGISRGFSLALQHSQVNSSSKFIRLRTDFLINDSIKVIDQDKDIYFGGPGVNPGFGYVSDQFFICSAPVAEVLAECEMQLFSYITNNGWEFSGTTPFYGERILSYVLREFLVSNSIQITPVIGAIKRPEIIRDTDLGVLKHFLIATRFNFRRLLKYFLTFLAKQKSRIIN